jgi:hypothetical protein
MWGRVTASPIVSITAIAFISLHVGFYELGTDEFHSMTELLQLPRPVLRAPAGLYPDETRRQLRHCLP